MVGRRVLYSDRMLIHTYFRGKSSKYMLVPLDKVVLNVCPAGRWYGGGFMKGGSGEAVLCRFVCHGRDIDTQITQEGGC